MKSQDRRACRDCRESDRSGSIHRAMFGQFGRRQPDCRSTCEKRNHTVRIGWVVELGVIGVIFDNMKRTKSSIGGGFGGGWWVWGGGC